MCNYNVYQQGRNRCENIHNIIVCMPDLASFPGLARLSLAVRNLRRRPGLVHHVIHATGYVTTILLMS